MDVKGHIYEHPEFKINKGDIIRKKDKYIYYYVCGYDKTKIKKVIVKRLIKIPEFYANVGMYKFRWDDGNIYKIEDSFKYSRLSDCHIYKPGWFVLPNEWVSRIY